MSMLPNNSRIDRPRSSWGPKHANVQAAFGPAFGIFIGHTYRVLRLHTASCEIFAG